MPDGFHAGSMTRRDVLTGALALGVLPAGNAHSAQSFVRRSVTAGDFDVSTLNSFKRAIRAMLALPPSDPRNWYRQAIIHVLDCPHANWWFLPWHRGYLFHFEEICRDLCEAPEFALPYWDWTSSPRVPDALFDDVMRIRGELVVVVAGADGDDLGSQRRIVDAAGGPAVAAATTTTMPFETAVRNAVRSVVLVPLTPALRFTTLMLLPPGW